MNKCPKCGGETGPGEEFCGKCGVKPVEGPESDGKPSSQPSKLVLTVVGIPSIILFIYALYWIIKSIIA